MCRKLIYLFSFVLVLDFTAGVTRAELRHHWRLDGNLADTRGSLDLTSTGGTVFITGKHGGAVEFDGSGDYIYAELAVFMPSQTTCVWVKTDNTGQSILGWSGNHPTDGLHDRELYVNADGTVTVRVWTGVATTVTSQTLVDDGAWHHLATGYTEGGETWLYVDGVSQGSTPSSNIYNSYPTSYLTVGIESNVNSYLTGAVDDIRVYDEALSQGQVLGAMTGGAFPFAFGPVPKDGTLHEDTWISLSWRPGDMAVSHDVYIGDNFDDVNAGAESTFHGNQTAANFVAGFPGFPYPDGLVPGTTYYWRIDEVNDTEPNSPWKGDIWNFSIPPRTAYFPDPADAAESIDPDVDLRWTAGFGAVLHYVYFGDNFDDVSNAAGGLPLGSATFDPGPLQLSKTYYWRVDEFDAIETYKGDIWSFTTEGAVGNPNPANGAMDVKQTQIITFSPSVFAASHELYFGTDKDAVKNADTGSPEYKGTRDLGAETYDPGMLEWDTAYYWRIDEVNNTNPDSPWTGILWSFTTANFLIVDDFESYNDLDPADPDSNRIFNAWLDGYDDPANGSLVGYDNPPFAEQTIIHGGNQSMPLYYDNSVGYSEATLTLTYPRDWTEKGVNTLTIWFRGNSDNAAETLYVALNGNAIVTNDNPDAAQITTWTEWTIDLQAFGINLANVNTIALGLGNRNNPLAGGSGTMYFDDIRLYRPPE
ncbi:MAG TPA: LamG-like jellyroll fold domain-containing protein [Sedimentisphaerales bacterium]|nr:LamG-like jellyroll fold domain-containing protein [Sedimentisphaerales bacterium]